MPEYLSFDPNLYRARRSLLREQAHQEHRPMDEVEVYQYIAASFCELGSQLGNQLFDSVSSLEQSALQLVIRLKEVNEQRGIPFQYFRDNVVFAQTQKGENHG